jgi:uncharacterized OB-fold protein
MTRRVEELEAFIVEGQVCIPMTYSAGAVGSRFLIEIRDNKKIMGMRCSKCNIVYVPPRSTCPACFAEIKDWVALGDEGTLVTFTVAHQSSPVLPVEPPVMYGIIQLDGAGTGFVHMLGEVKPEELKVGMKVKAVFKEERTASILDILYFKPLK